VLPSALSTWLGAFAAAVRAKDFAAGRALFDPGVIAFGTVCPRADGLDQLVEDQWSVIWNGTSGFDFDYATAECFVAGAQASIVATWTSTGFTPDRRPFQRRGRATLVLHASNGLWKAVHSHFSLTPTPAAE
jgi:ketosteroid isomerase-like protein